MKRIISLTLITLLTQMLFVHAAFAGTKEEKFTEKVKTEISKLGTGTNARISVKLKDGTKLKGYIMEANENQFIVMNSKTGQAVPVAYPQVGQAKGNNLSSGTIVILGVIGLVILSIILAGSIS